jgi:hypothetical protein
MMMVMGQSVDGELAGETGLRGEKVLNPLWPPQMPHGLTAI